MAAQQPLGAFLETLVEFGFERYGSLITGYQLARETVSGVHD